MELKNLFTEERAVSPVIAVVLMIAVTVILAAVVAAFALGLGGSGDTTPQASFDFDPQDNTPNGATDTVVVTMEGGDVIETPELVEVLNDNATVAAPIVLITAPVQTGSSASIEAYGGDTVRVRWTGEGEKTTTLAVYEVK